MKNDGVSPKISPNEKLKSRKPAWLSAFSLVKTSGLEPPTPCMSSRYSNQLSYAFLWDKNPLLLGFPSVSKEIIPCFASFRKPLLAVSRKQRYKGFFCDWTWQGASPYRFRKRVKRVPSSNHTGVIKNTHPERYLFTCVLLSE